MKFNLKLFVLVGVLAGFRDVCGMEDINNKDYGDFIVNNEALKKDDDLKKAIDEKRVIKAVYKTGNQGVNMLLMHNDFKDQLFSILVWDGNNVEIVKAEKLGHNIVHSVSRNTQYTVYFIFNTVDFDSTCNMFDLCGMLISADFRFFNTTNVTDMSHMFNGCSSLTTLNLSNFNTKNVTNMSYMFSDCTALTGLDLSNFNTKNVTSMAGMFSACTSLIGLDLSNFNTKNVTDMSGMFHKCPALKNLDLRNFYFSCSCKMDAIWAESEFDNLCLPDTSARCWCCCGGYVCLKGKVFVDVNINKVVFTEYTGSY